MQEIIERLTTQAGLTEEQARKAIDVLKDFAKEKFPMFGSAVDNMFNKFSSGETKDFLD